MNAMLGAPRPRTLAARWEDQLIGLQSTWLARLPLDADGSASSDVLARRAAVRQSLPASVAYFSNRGTRAVRLELGGIFAFTRPPLDERARSFLVEVDRDRVMSTSEPGGHVVWVALDAQGMPGHPLHFALEHAVALRSDEELQRRRRALVGVYDAIGRHPADVPMPDGSPDLRIRSVARMGPNDGPRPLTAADLVHDMEAQASIAVVPPEVEAIAQTARLLYVRGWHQWEFFTLAQREAVFALEASLRLLDADERGIGSRRPLSKLLDEVGRSHHPSLLSDWDRREGHTLREMRNAITHPTRGQTIAWESWARHEIERSVRLINLMWARRRASVPLELGWERGETPGNLGR